MSNPRARPTLFALGLLGLSLVGMSEWVLAQGLTREDFVPGKDSFRIEARDGRLLRESVAEVGSRRIFTPIDELSPLVVEATIAVEDARFYAHSGVDGRAVARAMVQAVEARRIVSGASTITMQLARLVEPHARRTFRGKVAEAISAWQIERRLSKREILEQYLNRAPYGAGSIGIEAASRRYFGKSSTNLSLAEAALLAGLPKAPSELDPRVAPERALMRRQLVLSRMLATGRASREDVERAQREPLQLNPERTEGVAMHFTELALARAAKLQPQPSGAIRTTLEVDLEAQIETAVRDHVARLHDHGLTHAAVVVIDHSTCELVALTGSAGYDVGSSGTVNGALARRQPGSTLKPFTYALAFERGFSPAAVVADVPTRYGDFDGPTFAPKNFDGAFSGPVTASEALARSLNVPAIRVAGWVGAEPLLNGLHAFGFDSLDKSASFYGLGLTLGNGEVTLLELTEAYATVARGGRSCEARVLAEEPLGAVRQVVSSTTAELLTRILSDERLRSLAFGRNNVLGFDGEVALKTGTSSDFRDGWTLGFTDRFAIGVWVGDFEGRPMDHLAGVTGAGPLFRKVVEATRQRHRARPLPRSDRLEEVEVCAASGHRATDRCPIRRTISARRGEISDEPCPFHRPVKIDRRNGLLAGESCAQEQVLTRVFEVLPPKFAAWQAASGNAPPTRYSPLCPKTGVELGTMSIERPRVGETFVIEPGYSRDTQALELAVLAEPSPESVTWWVDGAAVATVSYPYSAEWKLEPGTHEVFASAGQLQSPVVRFVVR